MKKTVFLLMATALFAAAAFAEIRTVTLSVSGMT
jgi:hypothetical protein